MPLRQFILKVHGLCNLACDHCYVYEHADQTWRDRPRFMDPRTIRVAARRIAAHARRHALRSVQVVLHGGEPLLLGERALDQALRTLRGTIGPVTALDVRMQTNGIRLTDAVCDVLLEHDVRVGVSLDGDAAANDRHRRYRNGASSHARTLRGIALLREPRYRRLYAGILCTVDVDNDPVAVYEALRAEEPPRVDLLLPHATWDTPPPHARPGATPYADWLLRVHRRWAADGRPMPIRIFDAIDATAAGRSSGTEALGVDPADHVVIETDGAWEQPDSMKTAFHGAAGTGLTVFTAGAQAVLERPAMRQRQRGLAGLCAACRACPVVRQCGGGLFAHRYRSGGAAAGAFDNPSVYCDDLKELITTMNTQRSATDLTPAPLPGDAFDEVAAGAGGHAAVELLVRQQESVSRALLVRVADRLDPAAGRAAAEAWPVFGRLDATAPDAVRRVVTHPFVRAWAVHCLRTGTGHDRLADLAAAAAVLAGADLEVTVVPRDGRVHLPTLGTLVLPDPAAAWAVVSGDGRVGWPGGTARLHDAAPAGPAGAGWHPARTAAVGGRTVLIEDADPYRDCHDWPAGGRLGDPDAARWQRVLGAAWEGVELDAPGQADGLRRAWSTLTPLVPADGPALRSATARHAFGATGVALTGDADAMAVLLVHEFQHTKLGAVLDLHDLLDPGFAGLIGVGWRPDPRPAEAVLQGVYAHLAVTGMWRSRAGRGAGGAAAVYDRYLGWTTDALRRLRATPALTRLGHRFADRMADTLDQWRR